MFGLVLVTRRGTPSGEHPPLPRWLKRLGWTLLAVALLASAFEIGNVPARLLASLERPYVSVNADIEPADAVLVLGGYGQPAPNGSLTGLEVNDAGDRLVAGIELVRHGKGKVLVLSSGGRGEPPEPLEAIAARNLVESWKVLPPTAKVELLGACINTRDEAVKMVELAKARGWKQIILVTSAWHLRRAAALFKKAGLEVIPVGCDFQGTAALQGERHFAFVSRTSSLVLLKLWLEETVGYAYYRLRGWV